jgi:hypothetical protein
MLTTPERMRIEALSQKRPFANPNDTRLNPRKTPQDGGIVDEAKALSALKDSSTVATNRSKGLVS